MTVVGADADKLGGRTLYVPQMCPGGTRLFCAAFRGYGVNARPVPDSDARTRELAARYCTGDECYPHLVTLGDFLKITEAPDFNPDTAAFFMPTTCGPCRFGQYHAHLVILLRRHGLDESCIISPTCEDGYKGLGRSGAEIMHVAWWGLVAADLLRRALLRTRPYERVPGSADALHAVCLADAEATLEQPGRRSRDTFADLKRCMARCHERFEALAWDRDDSRPLIGLSGEIFCRLNPFVNDDLARRVEQAGGEVWLSDVAEWVNYCNQWEMEEIRTFGSRWSLRMLGAWLTHRALRGEEHELAGVFAPMLTGREEPESVQEIVDLGSPYLEPHAGLGEMILNLGRAAWLHRKGADGMIDASPFSCMNGIVSESIYPRVSADLDGMPIRTFYFDGTQTNLDEDIAIFMELACHYSRHVKGPRPGNSGSRGPHP